MSVARRGESGAASASSYWRLSQRRIQSSCWAAAATRRRWAAAARANRNSAVSSGPIITCAAKPPIAAMTRTTAIPIANISYNNIGSPPSLAVGTKPLAYFLNFHFQRENDTIARDMPQAQAKWLPLLPNFEHANLVSGSRRARKSFGEGEVGLAAKGPFHWPQPTYF